MDKAKTHLSFIHRFVPPKNETDYGRAKQQATQGKAFTTFLLLYGTRENEQDLIPLAYELDKREAIPSPGGKVLENLVYEKSQ